MHIMSVERGLNPVEFKRVLVSPKFRERVLAIARFTLSTHIEGGMAVYKNLQTAKLSISQPIMPDFDEIEIWRQNRNESVRLDEHLTAEDAMNSFYDFRLVDDGRGNVRRDIGLLIHSHPNKAWDHLRPSLNDLELFAETRGNNPRLIEGILQVKDDQAKLKLFRESSSVPFSYFHDYVNEPPNAEQMDVLLHEHGFNTAVANFVLGDEDRLSSRPAQVVNQLFQ
jgi:hypothetical protein